jgi:DNA polymerase III subunit delta'
MAFKDIAGNGRVKKILKIALQRNRVPSSLLFIGPPGVGKLETAETLAKALNCRTLKDDACEVCPSCRAIHDALTDPDKQGKCPDVMMISLVENKKKVGIDQIRLLKQMAYLKPMNSKVRVFIVEDADIMSPDAANSILKVLEEPPPRSTIILVTENPHLILPTIRSRCRSLEFSSLGREEIENVLVEKGFARDEAKFRALVADGDLETAVDLDDQEARDERDVAWESFESMLSGREALEFLSKFAFSPRSNAEPDFKRTLAAFASFCRDLILIKAGGETRFLLNPDREAGLRKAAGLWGFEEALDCLARTDSILAGLSKNMNMNLLAGLYYSTFGETHHV